nr:hypothetical protein [Chitinispirillaceae bacterium]
MNIIYYVTSHGYGHGVRTAAICNALSPSHRLIFRTSLPRQFFCEELSRDFSYEEAVFDCGCIQHDSVNVAYEETLSTYRGIAARNRSLLEDEVRWIKQQHADVI